MPEIAVATDIHLKLELAEQQAAELWSQSEQIGAAYRAVKQRIDRLRDELTNDPAVNDAGSSHSPHAAPRASPSDRLPT